MKKTLILFTLIVANSITSQAQESIKVATWNIEHLGGGKRGGYYGCHNVKDIPSRRDADLDSIASLIQKRSLDIIALQEVTLKDGDCENLHKIVDYLGDNWEYRIPKYVNTYKGYSTGMSSLQTAYIFNTKTVRLDTVFCIYYPEIELQNSDLHDRPPFIAKFTCLKNGVAMNDFILVNLHLASGQSKTHNKAVAMSTITKDIEMLLHEDKYWLEASGIEVEDDIVFLGDFNHDPFDRQNDKLHSFMTEGEYTLSKYRNLLNPEESCTRMNTTFSSRIDHVYVSEGMEEFLEYDYAKLWKPEGPEDCINWGEWRKTYSDHFPLYFQVNIRMDE